MHTNRPYLYKWTHIPSGMWYVGSKTSAKCHPDNHEKYICSSKIVKPLVKKNRDDWKYEILVIGPAAFIRNLEKQYLKSFDARNNPMSYNQSNSCCEYDRRGIKDGANTRLKKSIARQGNKNPMFGKTGELSPHYGKSHSTQRRQKQSVGVSAYAKNRPDTHNENISTALRGNPNVGLMGEKNGMYGKPAHPNAIEMSKLKNTGENNPMRRPEHQKQCVHCNKTIAKNHYTMFHGDKCRNKIQTIIDICI